MVARIECRNYRRFDEQAFQDHIEQVDWSEILDSQDANVAALLFQDLFLSICVIYAPLKTINIKEIAPAWMTGDYLAHVDE